MGFGITVNVATVEDKKAVELVGRIDATTAPLLEKKLEALIEQKDYKWAVDFSKVEYLSSAGLRVLLAISKKLNNLGGKMVFYSMTDEVMDIIKIGGFKTVFAIFPNRLEAFNAL